MWTPYFLAAASIRAQARSRSSSVTPSTWSNLNTLFNEATKLAGGGGGGGGGGGTKSSTDPAVADHLLAKIDEISKIFWETKQG